MEVASSVASTRELVMSASSRASKPFATANCPFTLEIIMCFTLNSATEWAGSMFQVVVVCGVASALIRISFSDYLIRLHDICCNKYLRKKLLDLTACSLQQFRKLTQALLAQMSQLFLMS